MMAAVMTLAVTFALTLYALFTKKDFTIMGGTLLMVLILFVIVGIFASIGGWTKTHYMLYSFIGVLIYGVYLIYDVQLIAGSALSKGPERKYEYDLDDYIVASLQIYIDIVMMFTYIL